VVCGYYTVKKYSLFTYVLLTNVKKKKELEQRLFSSMSVYYLEGIKQECSKHDVANKCHVVQSSYFSE